MGKFWHHITGDSQLRWIGPDKGAIHLATGAVVNAVWDLYAKQVRTQLFRKRRERARVGGDLWYPALPAVMLRAGSGDQYPGERTAAVQSRP